MDIRKRQNKIDELYRKIDQINGAINLSFEEFEELKREIVSLLEELNYGTTGPSTKNSRN